MLKKRGVDIGPKLEKTKEIVCVILAIYLLLIISKLPSYFGLYLPIAQCLAGALLLAFLLHFLVPVVERDVLHWVDIFPFLLGLPGTFFATFFYDQVLEYELYGFLDATGTILTFSLAAGLLIAVYRRTGWVLPALMILLLMMVRFQNFLPGLLQGPGYDWNRLGFSLYVGSEGLFGIPFKVACTILIAFIAFGQLFQKAGGGKWFLNLATSIFGSATGGPAKVGVAGSALFGMISGSPSANTATTGVFTIPMMKETGYRSSLAGAIEAVASTGGQFLPPVMGAIAFLMAEWLSISYADIVFAATLPAICYFIIVFSSIHFEALRNNRVTMLPSNIPSRRELIREGWPYVISFTVLIVLLLFVFEYAPGQCAVAAMVAIILLSFFTNKENRLYFNKIWSGLVTGVEIWLRIGLITSAIGMIVGSFALSGLGVKISDFLIQLGGGNLLLTLVLVGIASFVLGTGLDSIPCYITLAILTAPALVQLGLPHIAAHLFVVYWGLASFITPPTCLAVYVACGISGGGVWSTGKEAVRIGIGAFLVPFAFCLSPALLLIGTHQEIIIAAVSTIVGAVFLASGLNGYFLKFLSWPQRVVLIIGGVFLILPGFFQFIGLLLVILCVGWQWTERKYLSSFH